MNKQRIVTALILLPIALAVVLLLPEFWTTLVFALLVLFGAWEWSAFMRINSQLLRFSYVVLFVLLMALVWQHTEDRDALMAVLAVAALWWVIAFAWVALFPTRVSSLAAAVCGMLVLVPAWIALVRLHAINGRGPLLVLFLLMLVWAADVGAYFVGRRLGKTKLAPLVSPGKTWEGVIGGLLASMLLALCAVPIFDLPAAPFLALCCAVVVISVVGDLTESLFKRFAGVKDSGTLLPGHGGVLDRIDSVTAAAPFFVLGLGYLGVNL